MLYVFYGEDRNGTVKSIERGKISEILALNKHPWEEIKIEGQNTFINPMVFPKSEDTFLIFGGHQQLGSRRQK